MSQDKRYQKFFIDLLNIIYRSQGNPQVIYPFLQQNLEFLDEGFGNALQQWARETFASSQQEDSFFIAGIIGEFGNLIQQFPLGQIWLNLEISILCYDTILTVFSKEQKPELWAAIQDNLARVYLRRIRGKREENIEVAIICCQRALQVRRRSVFPILWATTQNKLANSFSERLQGKREENIEVAINIYLETLAVLNRAEAPKLWADLQNNLANAYSRRIRGKITDNFQASITAYKLALEIYTNQDFPERWAMTQNNLAVAYRQCTNEQHADNLEASLSACKKAFKIYTRDDFPAEWASVQQNLALAYKDRIRGNRADNLEASLLACKQALKIYTYENFPAKWASIQQNLASAYKDRIRGNRTDNLEASLLACKQALKIYTRDDFPTEWASIQQNISFAYRERIKGNQAHNIELSISACKRALEIYIREDSPPEWASVQLDLALAYQKRIKGNRADNIETSILACRKALKIYTRNTFPEGWATAQNNLGMAYSHRIKGDRSENLEASLQAYQQALKVLSYERFPQKWGTVQNNLAISYSDQIKGDRSSNLEAAILAYHSALRIRTYEDFPLDWAMTQNNLSTCYVERLCGEKTENIEKAIAAVKQTLRIYTCEDFPVDWATVHHNLAAIYANRINGDLKSNIEVAIKYYNLSLEVLTIENHPEKWASTQHNLAETYHKRVKGKKTENIKAAITCYKSALTIRTIETLPIGCLQSSRSLGSLYFSQEQWPNAIANYELAIEALEVSRNMAVMDQRRQEIIADFIEIFIHITQSHVELGQIDKALMYAERSKARNLTELLASRELYPKGDINPEVIDKLKELRSQIPTLDRQLQVLESNRNDTNPLTQQAREQISAELKQARTELDDVLKIIQPIDPTFTLTQTVQPITFKEIQDLLDDQTAILEWYITEEKTFAFLVTKDQTQPILHTVETKDIADAVQKYLELYSQTQRFTKAGAKEQFGTVSKTLCKALQLDQIFEQLQQFDLSKLILIPHRYLHFLPLHALTLEDGSCLVDHFSAGVSYAPSCQLLQVLERQEKSDVEHFFAIKNPTEDLLFSELEVEAISDYFSETDILDRHNASESNFRNHPNLEKSSHLYFSCHGTFDFQSPLNSALLLNKTANDEDNRLTLAEIFELSLPNCSLVSLSACETGITDLNSLGDEYIGLPSGFIYAGASAVISSLWPVSDLATAILMIQTYYYLKHGLPNQQKQIVLPEPSPFGFSFQGLDGSLQTGQTPMATTRTITSSEQLPTPAQALNAAQNWMRTLTPEKGQKFIDRIMPTLDRMFAIKPEMTEEEKEDQEILKEAYLDNLAIITQPNCPFIHPYYWAAFTAVGI